MESSTGKDKIAKSSKIKDVMVAMKMMRSCSLTSGVFDLHRHAGFFSSLRLKAASFVFLLCKDRKKKTAVRTEFVSVKRDKRKVKSKNGGFSFIKCQTCSRRRCERDIAASRAERRRATVSHCSGPLQALWADNEPDTHHTDDIKVASAAAAAKI